METLRPEGVKTVSIHVGVIHFNDCLGFVISEEIFEFDNTASESEGESFVFDIFSKKPSGVSEESDMEIV